MFAIDFWKHAFERAIKTAAQAVLTVWVVPDIIFNALEIDWELAGGVALGGLLLSLLTSIASTPFGDTKGDPSLI